MKAPRTKPRNARRGTCSHNFDDVDLPDHMLMTNSYLELFTCRLIQNRKSAKKCRQKKKELLKNIVGNFGGIQEENMALKSQVSLLTHYYS